MNIEEAVKALKEGKLVVYPTDTLYALGANIFNERVVRKVFLVKKRDFGIPLPVAVSSIEKIEQVASVNDNILNIAKQFLPGPLTLVLNKKDSVPDIVTSNSDKIAVRIPDNEVALELLRIFGPLTVTSANIHGTPPGATIDEIKSQFRKGDISVFLDAGRLEGKPSTIIDLTKDKIEFLREGAIEKSRILDVI